MHLSSHAAFLTNQKLSGEKLTLRFGPFQESITFPFQRSVLLLDGSERTIQKWSDFVFPNQFNDGLLTPSEVQNLQLDDTEFVFLSACDTGIGISLANEIPLGFPRSFLKAGSKSVIYHIWQVEENASKEYSEQFHKYWWRSHNVIDAFEAVLKNNLSQIRERDGLINAIEELGSLSLLLKGIPIE